MNILIGDIGNTITKICLLEKKRLKVKKIVYINDNGEIISCKTKDYQTNWKSSGYRIYERQNIKLN